MLSMDFTKECTCLLMSLISRLLHPKVSFGQILVSPCPTEVNQPQIVLGPGVA